MGIILKGKCSNCDHDMEIHDNKIGCSKEELSDICSCLHGTEYNFIDDIHGVALWECKKCGVRLFDFDTLKHSCSVFARIDGHHNLDKNKKHVC